MNLTPDQEDQLDTIDDILKTFGTLGLDELATCFAREERVMEILKDQPSISAQSVLSAMRWGIDDTEIKLNGTEAKIATLESTVLRLENDLRTVIKIIHRTAETITENELWKY